MVEQNGLNSLRTFLIVLSGQLVSAIGSRMTSLALTIWAWELTSQATTLTLVEFFSLVPSILIAPFAGMMVDRCNRKLLMIVGDTVAAVTTLALLPLYLTHHLQIWHLCLAGAIKGTFTQLQGLAYLASLTLMIPKRQYARASSLEFLLIYGPEIVAPALAGTLYYIIGLVGISIIDLLSFMFAISVVLLVPIPQPTLTTRGSETESPAEHQRYTQIRQELGFGLHYISAHPSLLALLVSVSLFWFSHDIGNSLYSPMILARTGHDARVLGTLVSAAGIGGILGVLLMSTWGGPKRRVQGILLGMIGAGLSKTLFGLGQTPWVWLPTQFCSSLNFPMMGGSEQAIWLAKIKPNLQGRVFAANRMIRLITMAVAILVAGPLADRIFEPAMMPQGSLALVFGGLLGTGPGAGMALLFVSCALCMLLVGLGGYAFSTLRNLEDTIPDHDVNDF